VKKEKEKDRGKVPSGGIGAARAFSNQSGREIPIEHCITYMLVHWKKISWHQVHT
jgi:hypothetical protein